MRYTHEDGTPFTKEEFLQKLKTDKEFNNEFGNKGIDQISELIKQLKDNPDSRRMVVNAWAVHDLPNMTLPPCHYSFQVYTRELSFDERFQIHRKYITADKLDLVWGMTTTENLDKLGVPTRAISLMWNQRSVDTFLGLPFNIASYGLLLEIIAKAVNMVPDELIGNLGDTHLYSNHIEQAKEQIGREMSVVERMEYYGKHFMKETESKTFDELLKINYDELNIPTRTREPYPLPNLVINDEFWNPDAGIFEQIEHIKIEDFDIRDYQSHPTIKAPLSN